MEDLQPQVKNETIEQNKLIFALNKKEKTASIINSIQVSIPQRQFKCRCNLKN